MRPIRNLRWWIAALLAAATALNYLDRQSLPVVISELQKSIQLTDRQYSQLQAVFLFAYALMYAGGGRIMDWIGTRAGYGLMVIWWSAASLAHGLVSSALGLGIARFLLGLGEGGGFPGSAKAVSEWFPPRERSSAFGIFNTGSAVGAVFAPPFIATIAIWLGWRWVFFLTGLLGFLWGAVWLKLYHLPQQHPLITAEESACLAGFRETTLTAPVRVRWLDLFGPRQVWGLLAAKLLSDSAGYFFILWTPKYLSDARHLNIREIGYYAWIPYAFAGVGSFTGGWLSSRLLRRNFSIDQSRKLTLAIGAALMPASLLIVASPLGWAIFFFSMALFAHQFWSTIMQTLAADMFPPQVVGSVAGLMGAAGAFGGMLFNLLAGSLLGAHGSYAAVFLIAGLLHPISFLLILVLVRRIELVSGFSPQPSAAGVKP